MRAAFIEVHGGLDCLRVGTLPDPEPGPGEVVVRVKACALNRLDLWVREGWPGLTLSFPHVPGSDIAGVVEGVGPGVSGATSGDEVVVNPGKSCGRCQPCLSDRDNLCDAYAVFGEHCDGGYAERVCVPAANLCPKPAGLSWAEAAATPLTFLTAWQMLVDRCDLRPGEIVLVHAGGSGVGVAAIQIARMLGATVIATSSSDDKLARAMDLGAAHGVNYKETPKWGKRVRALSGGGVDHVVEVGGAGTLGQSLTAVKVGGTISIIGVLSGVATELSVIPLLMSYVRLQGILVGHRESFEALCRAAEAAQLRPVIDSTYPLEQTRDALEHMAAGGHLGKICIEIG